MLFNAAAAMRLFSVLRCHAELYPKTVIRDLNVHIYVRSTASLLWTRPANRLSAWVYMYSVCVAHQPLLSRYGTRHYLL